MFKTTLIPTFLAGLLALLSSSGEAAQPGQTVSAANDYPTAARAEYVFACMATNGGTQQALGQCACAVDVIASLLPYADYERAETVMRMRRMPGGGYLAQEFRVPVSNNAVRTLEEAQAEADVRCF